ncbi:MAG: 3-hydroxyacyl-CoA dehydrogenase NAD-binding domain-containing protein [Pseudazoarcus pumilus]|nr:3-hydroxyacyl-CoA dehydrogenase NAD-binding domain-containing protein [Pseudazoarcus pumilus]
MNHHGHHLRLERDWEGVAWLVLDRAGERVNTLSAELLDELAEVVAMLEAEPPSGLVIASAKSEGFCAGADLDEVAAAGNPQAARALVERGWKLFARIACLPFPTLALIRGHCLGGGLELALACNYRIVVEDPSTRLGLPEVRLGLVPAWGGMRRLPALVGPSLALDMMLSGRDLSARAAWKAGLADVSVPPRVMESAARAVVMSGRHCRHLPWRDVLKATVLRRLVAAQARKRLATRVRREHYPAPFALLELWARHGGDTLAEPDESAVSIAALLRSDTARELLRVFRLRERLRRSGGVAHAVQQVHVIGAGTMGGDIAILCAASGFRVTLQDARGEAVAAAVGRAARRACELHRDDPLAQRDLLDRLVPDTAGHGVRRADLVIEAIAEDVEAKRTLFAELESRARPDALLATNTSSLALDDIAAGMRDPARLIGLHFFNPVAKMPLVEVVAADHSNASVVARASGFVVALGKLPLQVAATPGFLVNAVLAPYLFEALRCVDEGLAPAAIDRAMRDAGMPVGPIELVDRIGLDVALAAGRALGLDPVPACLCEAVEAGRLGLKSGHGLFEWRDGLPVQVDAGDAPEGLAERLFAPLDAAASDALARGVVADADLVDAGLVFGAGYPPFTGGPLRRHAKESA